MSTTTTDLLKLANAITGYIIGGERDIITDIISEESWNELNSYYQFSRDSVWSLLDDKYDSEDDLIQDILTALENTKIIIQWN